MNDDIRNSDLAASLRKIISQPGLTKEEAGKLTGDFISDAVEGGEIDHNNIIDFISAAIEYAANNSSCDPIEDSCEEISGYYMHFIKIILGDKEFTSFSIDREEFTVVTIDGVTYDFFEYEDDSIDDADRGAMIAIESICCDYAGSPQENIFFEKTEKYMVENQKTIEAL